MRSAGQTRADDVVSCRGAARALAPFALLALGACASHAPAATAPTTSMTMTAKGPDPRAGLKAGWWDPGEAVWNVRVVSKTRPSAQFLNLAEPGDRRLTNTDLAFNGHYVYQGNYSGYQVWDVSTITKPVLATAYVCPGSQNDVTTYRNLLFTSAEATAARTDCGMQGVPDTVSAERARGIRIFDVTDIARPKYIATVQTCRGSHTNTLVTDPKDPDNVYIYVSGASTVRSPNELPGCSDKSYEEDPETALFRIEVIQVPLKNPAAAKIISRPRIFADAKTAAGVKSVEVHAETDPEIIRAQAVRDSAARAAGRPTGNPFRTVTQCHDITVYPAIGLAGGACLGAGLLLDISDVKNPRRLTQVVDSNFSAWHSVTFNNAGTQVLFSDEWGGGSAPRCRPTDKQEWGADALFTIDSRRTLTFTSYYKIPDVQSAFENCVSHNGSLIPVPGRDILVQSFYQGGLTIFDWTNPRKPVEIGFYDMGPMDGTKLVQGGYWSTYWYNGYIYGSDEARGLDILELTPSPWLTQNEIEAAKLVTFDHLNVQEQPQFIWPAAFVVARAYVDQLVRDKALDATRTAAISRALAAAEAASGSARAALLTALAGQLDGDAKRTTDAAKVALLAGVVRQLAAR